MDTTPDEDAVRAAELAEMNEISGTVKWKYRPTFGIPKGAWKIGAIWDQAYLETAQYVLKGVVNGELNPYVHGVTGVFLFRHYVELGRTRTRMPPWLSGDDTPSTAGTVGKAGSGKDVSFENSPSYDLIGGHLKALVGHKVEVIGITSDTKLNNSDSLSSAIGSSKHEKATLTVSSVKMIAAKCP